MRILKPDGVVLVAMAGNETLGELRTALFLAEQERSGGSVSRCSPLIRGDDLSQLLSGAGFNLITCDIDRLRIKYPSVVELMQDLKFMGEQNAQFDVNGEFGNNTPLTYDKLLSTLAIYHSLYQTGENQNIKLAGHIQTGEDKLAQIEEHFIESEIQNDPESVAERLRQEIEMINAEKEIYAGFCVEATFDITHAIGWKPHPSQGKPKERGSVEKGWKLHPDRA